jgi:ubiquinone/menaquinone biosynthesis C-methylase UbiE
MTRDEQWQLTGDAAELYERYAARHILGPWVPGLMDVAGVQTGERVLDLACGTGVVARLAAERVGGSGRVTGLDLNRGMLDVARSLPPPSGAQVDWVQASALDTRLPDASFDVMLCQQGIQFFPDQPAALREMRRVLAPGGRIAISVWRTTGIYNSAVSDALARHIGHNIAARFCASRDAPAGEKLVAMITDAGFTSVKLHIQRMIVRLPRPEEFMLGHLAATPIAADIRSASSVARAALTADVANALASYSDGDAIAFPEETNVLTARKPDLLAA